MLNNKIGSELWSDNYFNSFKGMFVYRGCNLMKVDGGWKVFEISHITATTREEVDTIIDKACVVIKTSIKNNTI